MNKMITSDQGRHLIKQYEGLRLQAYLCPAGIPTIGWGHTKGVKMGCCITEQQAEEYLTEDLAPAEQVLNAMAINFRQHQFDALVSWIFNLGRGAFLTSTLYKCIQANANDEQIADQIVRWTNASGKQLIGLMKRRVAEANMFMGYERYKLRNSKIIKV